MISFTLYMNDALKKMLPLAAQNTTNRKSAVPCSIAKSEGYAISLQKRRLIEQGFGWAKFIGPIRQVMVLGLKKVDQLFVLTMTAYLPHVHLGINPPTEEIRQEDDEERAQNSVR